MDDEPSTGSVQLIVDYSDGRKKCFSNLPWKSDMSRRSMVKARANIPRPSLSY
jgi:hypothetical protein